MSDEIFQPNRLDELSIYTIQQIPMNNILEYFVRNNTTLLLARDILRTYSFEQRVILYELFLSNQLTTEQMRYADVLETSLVFTPHINYMYNRGFVRILQRMLILIENPVERMVTSSNFLSQETRQRLIMFRRLGGNQNVINAQNTRMGQNQNMVNMLIDTDADINTIDYQLATPLVNAIGTRNSQLVQLLLQRNANPNLDTTYMQNPMNPNETITTTNPLCIAGYIAYLTGDFTILNMLIEYNANINTPNNPYDHYSPSYQSPIETQYQLNVNAVISNSIARVISPFDISPVTIRVYHIIPFIRAFTGQNISPLIQLQIDIFRDSDNTDAIGELQRRRDLYRRSLNNE